MSNLTRLQDLLKRDGFPSLLLTDLANVRWLTGFKGSAGSVFVSPDRAVFFTDGRYTIQASEQVTDMPSATTTHEDPLAAQVRRLAQEWGIDKVGFEGDTVTYNSYKTWVEKLEGVELVAAKDLCGELRQVKTPDEIARIEEACKLTDACFSHALRMVRPGVTEYDIHLEIEFYFRRQGAELAFEPIVVSGDRSARPHGKASEKQLAEGDFLTMDFGAKLDGYCADLTRTVVVGKASDRHREIYGQVLEALTQAKDALRPGANGKDIDQLARDVLAEKDLAQYFIHGLGHGLGAVVHDHGRLHHSTDTPILEGQVWTVEPGVYIEGFGGVRIEDDVLVTSGDPRVLTHSPRELLILP